MRSAPSRAVRALAAIVVGVVLGVGGLAGPAAADEYPSWDDVIAAKANEESARAAVVEIQSFIAQLEERAAEANKEAQLKGEAYNVTKGELEAAVAKADVLQQQADAASSRAEISAQKAGQLVAQLARSGNGSITLSLLVSPDVDNLLNQLATMSKVSEQASNVYRLAVVDRNLAQSLTDQAEIAEGERLRLQGVAQVALDAANASADAANALLEEQQAASDQLYAQLASLTQTAVDVQWGFNNGVANQPPQVPSNPNPVTPGPGTPPPPSDGSAAAGAIAFAYAQLGEPYLFAGSGPDAWDCSGLTQAAYASQGIYIGAHLVSSQYYTMQNQGRLVWYENMQPGDLLYYADGGYPGSFYHVTMYVGGGQMVEAPRAGVPVRVTAVRYYDLIPYVGRPS